MRNGNQAPDTVSTYLQTGDPQFTWTISNQMAEEFIDAIRTYQKADRKHSCITTKNQQDFYYAGISPKSDKEVLIVDIKFEDGYATTKVIGKPSWAHQVLQALISNEARQQQTRVYSWNREAMGVMG